MVRDGIRAALARPLGVVRLRQWADAIRHRLSFVPGVYVAASAVLVQLSLRADRSLDGRELPDLATTTGASARSVFTAIAGGLITAITLLLSMLLVTVQLASSQFSPRTLRDWLGDRLVQHTVGLALGTTVFALLALRSTGDDGEVRAGAVVPHLTVIVVVVATVIALFMLVRSVDHTTHSVRIESVADRIARDTIDAIQSARHLHAGQDPTSVPTVRTVRQDPPDAPDGATPIESTRAGWIQQIDDDTLLSAIPEGSTAWVAVPIGGYVHEHTPLVWIRQRRSDASYRARPNRSTRSSSRSSDPSDATAGAKRSDASSTS